MNREYSDEQLGKVTARMEELTDKFKKSKHFDGLTDEQKLQAKYNIIVLGEYMYSYDLILPEEWTEIPLMNRYLDTIPRKASADKAYFENFPYCLAAYCRFMNDEGLMKRGDELADIVLETRHEFLDSSQDPSNWGMAKSFLMRAMDEGVNIEDEKELKQYFAKHNEIVANKQSSSHSREEEDYWMEFYDDYLHYYILNLDELSILRDVDFIEEAGIELAVIINSGSNPFEQIMELPLQERLLMATILRHQLIEEGELKVVQNPYLHVRNRIGRGEDIEKVLMSLLGPDALMAMAMFEIDSMDVQKKATAKKMKSMRRTHNLTKRVPRNAPCPCGSGKKYKRCHGK